MSAEDDTRPSDPAGTQPKHDPASLLPTTSEPLLPPQADVVESDAVDEDDDLLPERRRAGGLGPPVVARKHSQYVGRFGFLTGALIAVGVAAVAAIALLVIAPANREQPPPWSDWKPAADGVAGANQIADHVAQKYRDRGQQLVNVEASDLEVNDVPLTVAIRRSPADGGNIEMHEERGFIYTMCGLEPACAIAGKTTTERGLLVRREALELALYSFRYLDAGQVVVVVPPPAGQEQNVALYFTRAAAKSVLSQPLAASLTDRPPNVSTVSAAPDLPLVDRVTRSPFLFSFTASSLGDRGIMVLDPYSPRLAAERAAALKKLREEQAQAQAQAQAPATGE